MQLFFDFETDSLDTPRCQVTQAAVINQEGKTLFAKSYGIWQGLYIPAEESQVALNYTKTSDWQRDNLPTFSRPDFEFMVQLMLVADEVWAHNVTYDKAVLETYALRYESPIKHGAINFKCTMELACKNFGFKGQTRMKLPALKLDSIAHDAVSDTQNCWLLWQKCHGLGPWDKTMTPDLDF